MVCDVWCMVYGVWCMVYGVWCVVCDVWCVVCDVWCMVYVVWCMVCSVWCMVCGVSVYVRVCAPALISNSKPLIKAVSFIISLGIRSTHHEIVFLASYYFHYALYPSSVNLPSCFIHSTWPIQNNASIRVKTYLHLKMYQRT